MSRVNTCLSFCFTWQRSEEDISPANEIISRCYYNRIITELLTHFRLTDTILLYYPSRTIELNCIFFDYIKLDLLINRALCSSRTVANRYDNQLQEQKRCLPSLPQVSWSDGHLRAGGYIEEQAIAS